MPKYSDFLPLGVQKNAGIRIETHRAEGDKISRANKGRLMAKAGSL
jgi:hypothetical protein